MDSFIFSILVLVGLYYTCNRYNYWINVAIYMVYNFVCLAFFTTDYSGNLFTAILSSFIVSLIYIKLLNIINDHTNGPIWFVVVALVAGVILQFVMGMLLSVLGLIVSL